MIDQELEAGGWNEDRDVPPRHPGDGPGPGRASGCMASGHPAAEAAGLQNPGLHGEASAGMTDRWATGPPGSGLD